MQSAVAQQGDEIQPSRSSADWRVVRRPHRAATMSVPCRSGGRFRRRASNRVRSSLGSSGDSAN